MSEAMKGNVMENLEKNGIDLTATLDNLMKQFPDLIVYAKKDNDQENEESNKKCSECNNYHNNEESGNNKCNCYKNDNNENEEENENDQPNDFRCCMAIGQVDPQTAVLINILESLDMINHNICNIGDILEKNIPSKITGVAELKTCKMNTGISKKQLAKMLNKQKNDIYEDVSNLIELRFAHLKEMILNPQAFQNKESGKRPN